MKRESIMNKMVITIVVFLIPLFSTTIVQARFTQADTYEGKMQDPITLHKYLYANGNPANNIDPSGNITLAQLATATSVLTAVYATVQFTRFAQFDPIYTGIRGDALYINFQGLTNGALNLNINGRTPNLSIVKNTVKSTVESKFQGTGLRIFQGNDRSGPTINFHPTDGAVNWEWGRTFFSQSMVNLGTFSSPLLSSPLKFSNENELGTAIGVVAAHEAGHALCIRGHAPGLMKGAHRNDPVWSLTTYSRNFTQNQFNNIKDFVGGKSKCRAIFGLIK